MSTYRLISVKGTRAFTGNQAAAVQAAIAMEDELQPAYGVTVEDADGNTVAEIRDGVDIDADATSWEEEDEACITLGFWAKLVPGKGWVTCEPGDVGARPDINRLRAHRAGVLA